MISDWAPEDTPTPTDPPFRHIRRSAWGAWAILLIALLLGGYFRTVSLFDWDEPSFRLHPDERFMLMVASDIHLPSSLGEYLNSSVDPLNPRNRNHPFYVYGTITELLTRLTAVMLTPNDLLPPTVPDPRAPDPNSAQQVPNPELGYPKLTLLEPLLNPRQINLTDFYQIHKVGRAYSVLFDIGSILLTFLIARRLYGRRVAALAALLYALAVLPIQLAHFFAVDSASGFFVLLTIYCAVRIAQGGGAGSYVALGMSIGAAMACRITLATLGLIGVVAVAQRLWQNRRPTTDDRQPTTDDEAHNKQDVSPAHPLTRSPAHPLIALGLLALAGVLSVLTFRLLQPDAFMGTSFFDLRPDPRFLDNIAEIGRYVSGQAESPPSDQWANRVPYLFPLVNMVIWGMGLPFGLAAWAGWLAAGWQIFRRHALVHLIPWLSIALYFAWQGGILNPSMRYFVVLYGLFAIFAAWLLVGLWDRRRLTTDDRRPTTGMIRWWSVVRGLWSVVGRPLLIFVVIATLCWAYAFTRIYTQPHSRITASRWIYQNIPPGAKISAEQWDDPLPLNLDGRSSSQYVGIEMSPYAEDDPTKYTGFTGTDNKYNPGLLDQLDQLDYIILSSNRVYGSTSRLPMRFPALTRYYHYLFNGELGFELVADINSYPTLFGIPIPDQGAEEAFSVYDHPRVLIFKKSPDYSRQRAERLITGDVAWGEVYKLPAVRIARMPTALRLTEAQWPAYRDGGTWASLFNPAGLTNQLPWLFWLLALELLGLAIFPLLFRLLPGLPDRGFALAKTLGLLIVAYGAWLLGSLHVMSFTPGSVWLCAAALIAAGIFIARRNKAELLAFVRERRTALLTAEGLFLIAFFGFLLVRAANPDLWHPARGGEKPMDLAFLNAVLKSASFPPYDPWFAGGYINYYYFGFVFVGALIHLTGVVPTVAYNLAVPTMFALTALGAWGAAYNLIALRRPTTDDRRPTTDDRRPTTDDRRWSVVGGRIERRAITTGIVAAVFVVLVGNLANAFWLLPGSATPPDPREPPACQLSSYAAKERCKGREEWVFWDATRLVSLSLSTPENNDSTITEFPFFTFLYGDLHAHMIALPLALAALGLMVALIKVKGKRQKVKDLFLPSTLYLLPLLALVVGALRATNTWDYPAYLGLSVVTLGLLAWDRRRRGASWILAIGGWALAALGLFLLSNLLFLPFTRNFATDYAGFELWHGARTLASDYLKLNGLWLFLLGSAAVVLYQRIYRIRAWQLALLVAAVLLAVVAVVALHMIALALLVPLAGLSAGLAFELLSIRDPRPETRDPGRANKEQRTKNKLGEPRTENREPRTVSGPLSVVRDDEPEPITLDHALPDDEPETSTSDRTLTNGEPETITLDHALPDNRRPRARFSLTTLLPALWAIAALGLTLLVELIVAKGDAGRMNTVFKLGMQSWVLFAVSSAIALTWLWGLTARWLADDRRPTTDDRRWTATAATAPTEGSPYMGSVLGSRFSVLGSRFSVLGSHFSLLGWVWRGAAVLLVAAALVYPVTATPVRLADRYDPDVGITLDGAAYLRSPKAGWAENGKDFTFAEDADAFDWMRANIRGTPIVLEAQTEAYRWGGRVSIYTGLPTLLGWPGHESQQRAVALVDPVLESRRALVSQLYTTTSPSETLQLLRLYGVEYIYVGQLERALYDPAGLAKFDAMATAGQLQQVYAHGETSIYQLLPADHLPAVLTTSLPVQPPALPHEKSLMLDISVDQLPVVNDYAWDRLAESQPIAVLLWLLACYGLLLLGLPVAALVFGGDFRSGEPGGQGGSHSTGGWEWAWARLIGLLLLGYAVWLPVSARLWRYDRVGLLLGVLIVMALDVAVLAWMGRRIENEELRIENEPSDANPSQFSIFNFQFSRGLRALRDQLLARRRRILAIEGLFLGAFVFMAALRMLNPDLWQPIYGGEKPFEFGFINAILRSPVMPPYDPFFSGSTINYYYYGLFLVSLPIKATGIDPAVAFNLIIPTLYAILVTGAFALVVRLTGKARYGLAGVAFLALLGNLAAAFPVGSSRGIRPVLDALQGGLSDFGARLGDWFWGPSRVIIIPNKLTTINEFPYWSFLFADLHPHLIALPITLLMIAIVYELFDDRRPTTDDRRLTTDDRRPTTDDAGRWSVVGGPWSVVVARWLLAALTLGALAIANSWDFPTYTLLLGGALLGRAWRSARRPTTDDRTGVQLNAPTDDRRPMLSLRSSLWVRALGALLTTALIAGAALLLYLPFFQSFQAEVGGVGRVREGTPLILYILVYGLFLAVLVPAVFVAAWRLLRHQERLARGPHLGRLAVETEEADAQLVGIVASAPTSAALWRRLRRVLLIAPALLLAIGLTQPVLGLKLWLGALVLLGVGVLLARRTSPAVWFIIWMAVVGWAVSLGIELVYIRDHLDGGDAERMNTVFKFGFQIWLLLALAAAAALPHMARWLRRLGPLAQIIGGVTLAALVVIALVFPLAGTPSRLATRFPVAPGPTLDGLAFMDTAEFDVSSGEMGLPDSGSPIHISLHGDAAATRWLNENIDGTPVVLQSDLWFYRPYGVRVASNTGLPTVVSPLHASEQHDPDQVAERDRDVQTLYRTIDINQALQLLSKYRVGYVYVGEIERAAYGEAGTAKFDQMAGTYLNLAYNSDGVKIFKVNENVYSITPPPAGTPLQPVVAPQPPAAQPADGQASLEELERQVRLNPTVATLAFGLGQRYYGLGRYDDAITVLNQAATANPGDVPLHQLLGDVLRDAGHNEEAAAAYRAAAEASPTAGNYNKLGLHLLKMGALDQATEAFQQAITADPNEPEPFFHMGEIYEQQGQKAQAIEQYQKYLDIAPPDAALRGAATEAIGRLK